MTGLLAATIDAKGEVTMAKSLYIIAGTSLSLLIVASACSPKLTASQQTPPSASSDTRFTPPPPNDETPQVKELIDKAQAGLTSGALTITDVLTDGSYMPAHEWPRFRKLIREQTKATAITIVTPQEQGESLIVSGTVRDSNGAASKGALIYVYQTSARGWYSDRAAHVAANSGDQRHARLFGYLKTDEQGHYQFRTIRPVGYPNSDLPAHIHIQVSSAAGDAHLISEILFEGDPRLTKEARERSLREGLFIFPVKRDFSGTQIVEADFKFR
jgi:protocatechuate 3,4-dioxygenase beta subunit